METTAKVDLRKLQLLNDRINQTLDALNQLRVSVHGLQHSPSPMGFGVTSFGVPAMSFGQTGIGQTQIGTPFIGQPSALGHSSYYGSPAIIGQPGIYGQSVWQPNVWGTQNVWGQSNPYVIGGSPWTSPVVGGLSHSQWDVSDPYASVRAAQVFPYLFSPLSPVVGF
jgi:hypothetical protein